jgi:hypothetical protein
MRSCSHGSAGLPTVVPGMTTRGDLLALVDGAPGQLRTLQGALTTWTHRERAALALAWAAEHAGDDPGRIGTVAPLPGSPWGDDPAAADAGQDEYAPPDDEADPAGVYDATAASLALPHWPPPRPGDVDGAPEVVLSWYVAVAPPDRWRVVGRGQIAVSDGRRSWAGTSTLVTERDSSRAAIHDAGVIGACLYPGALLGGLELADPKRAEIEGRPCWVVGAEPRPDAFGTSLASAAAPHALRLHGDLVGIQHRLWFDAATGILVRHDGFVDGEACSTTRLSDLVVDAPLADTEFRPPPGAVVRARHELLRDHLAELGVDPDSVDLDDPAQVRAALRGAG